MNSIHPIKYKVLVEYIGKKEGIKPDENGLYDITSLSQEKIKQRVEEFRNKKQLDFNPEAE